MISKIFITSVALILLAINSQLVQALELSISGNGSESQNQITTVDSTQTQVVQNNEATVNNNIQTTVNSGGNNLSENNGDTNITTGNTENQIVVENQANVSMASNECCPVREATAAISGNGTNSINSINANNTNQTNVNIDQKADIKNEVSGQADTGGNIAGNNNGSVLISTGSILANANINNHDINIARATTNRDRSDISAKIADNGAWSTSTISVNRPQQNTTSIVNAANIDNQIYWNLSTGNNFANGNLGEVAILTGNVKFNLNMENGPVNFTEAILSCCAIIPSSTPNPIPSPTTNPEQISNPGDEGGNPAGGDGGGSSGEATLAIKSAAVSDPEVGEVLGAVAEGVLAAAGNYWLIFLSALGIITLAGGIYLRFVYQPEVTIKHLKLLS